MSNESLVRLQQSLSASSLADLVNEQTDYPMLLIDLSGSMGTELTNAETGSRTGKRRIDGLREVLTTLKSQGDVTMIAFGGQESDAPRFVDHAGEIGGGTPLHDAIRLAKTHGASRLVVISDGEPDLREETMQAAKEFGGRIDVCYVGDANTPGSFFMNELAKLTGGSGFQGSLARVKELAGKVTLMLMGDVEPARTVFAGNASGEVVDTGVEAATSDDDDDDADDDDDEEDEDEDDDDGK